MRAMTIEQAREHGWKEPHDALFTAWFNTMDKLCIKKLGLSLFDFPDWNFADAYEGGTTPEDAFAEFAEEQLSDMGFDPDEFDI